MTADWNSGELSYNTHLSTPPEYTLVLCTWNIEQDRLYCKIYVIPNKSKMTEIIQSVFSDIVELN